jgi:quercetin dioxygenase-like cupin family protein
MKMETDMAKAELKSFGKPDEVRQFPKGRLELVKIGGATVGRAVFEPGWRWATSVQPLAHTKSCEAPHFQYHVSGVLRILMDDGTEFDCKPGDVSLLPSGHDAWVVGNEPVVLVDFFGATHYAER